MAIHAVVKFLNNGGVISPFIELNRKLQNRSGAKFDAITATFAPVFKDMHHSPSNLNIIRIKWDAPKCHLPSLI
jgi:hypothetical protein